MLKSLVLQFLFFSIVSLFVNPLFAQIKHAKRDTFFLAKKKGLLGKLGQSLASSPEEMPVKIANPYQKYKGRTIGSIEILPFGFDREIDDTNNIKQNFAIRVGNMIHINTRESVIKKNLFFREGDRLLPLLISDNESFLRNLVFLSDARIYVFESGKDSVDIVVYSRDVFSIGGSINIGSRNIRTEVREENLGGSGNQFSISNIYDNDRKPKAGIGSELIFKNIYGTFLNWYSGFKSFGKTFNTGRYEENNYYTRLEKPLVTRYTQWTGDVEVSFHKTINGYISDSLYTSDFKYAYSNLDFWGGYNFGSRYKKGSESEKYLRHFVAGRTFYTYFDKLPKIFDTTYNSGFANLNGVLFSYSLYRQNFYRTNFIYGFGRNEDVPVGLSATFIGGWTNKQNKRRPYYAFEFEGTTFSGKGSFSNYKLRAGGYTTKGRFQDVNLLVSVDRFTRLKKINKKWYQRNFFSFSYTKQVSPLLNEPLFLRSSFGLPYFANGTISADERATLKLEKVYYNLKKILGFRFAPFLFGDMAFLIPTGKSFNKIDGFSALGGGIRTRNENLVFGTIELKGYFFPRTTDGMKNWKVDFSTKLRFKFNNNFIKKPEFIIAN